MSLENKLRIGHIQLANEFCVKTYIQYQSISAIVDSFWSLPFFILLSCFSSVKIFF